MGWKLTIYVIFVWLMSIKHDACGLLNHLEGSRASLIFHFKEPNISVSLHKEENAPFYINHRLVMEKLSPSQQSRFGVEEVHSNLYKEVRLTIDNISRTDSGVYNGIVDIDGNESNVCQSITLKVNFPPGEISCAVVTSPFNYTWDSREILECHAEAGSGPADIVCFQNREIALPITETISDHEVLSRLVWKQKSSKISCCTLNKIQFPNKSNEAKCNGFSLAPTKDDLSHRDKAKRSKFSPSGKHSDCWSPEQASSIRNDVMWKNLFILLVAAILVLGIMNLLITSNVSNSQDNSLRMISEILDPSTKKY